LINGGRGGLAADKGYGGFEGGKIENQLNEEKK